LNLEPVVYNYLSKKMVRKKEGLKRFIPSFLSREQTRGGPDKDALRAAPPQGPVLREGVEEIDESQFPEVPPALNTLSINFMKRFRFVPLEEAGEHIRVGMADPFDFNTIEAIGRAFGKPVKVFKVPAETISQFIYRWYEAETDMTDEGGHEELELSIEDHLWENPEQLKDMATEAPVIRLVNHIISRALKLGASDIHIEPRRAYVQVRYRIDGVLHDQEALAKKLRAAITSRVKLMAKMDIAEMRLPQDGRIKFKMARDDVDIRVSALPTQFGEGLVLRLLHKEDIELDLDNLGFPRSILKRFKSSIALPYGMILVTGPTGSGKTTTLYAALNTINTPDKKIVTVEDPIEYQLEGINQVQVQSNIGLTFASCLRSFLRHDPDVMLIGEIRDQETAEIAIQAALTGHMVFSTLHTNDAAGAISRLEDMGVERFMIASSVVGVLAQRLVRRVCAHCGEDTPLSEEERGVLARDLEVDRELIASLYRKGKGCKECGETGYRGRLGIFELLHLNEVIQKEVIRGADRSEINRKAVEVGMTSLRMDGLDKVNRGITTYEEVLRVTR
jgi:general secretion pathway protein E